jgi:hypothetical protein
MHLFLSYARQDRSKADLLARRVRQLGHDAWLDANLVGGQAWWDEILRRVRDCDAILSVISPAYVRSEACTSEREYALQLRKPVLPVLVEHMRPELLPADISRLQVVDYSTPGEESAIQLAVGLMNMNPVRGLPVPLPPPPPPPISYLSELNSRVTVRTLSLDEQLGLAVRLESALGRAKNGEDRALALDLLHRLSERRDLYAEAERKITQVLASSTDIPPSPVADTKDAVAWQATLVRAEARERDISVRLSSVEFVVQYMVMPIFSSTGAIIRIGGGVREERSGKAGDHLNDETFDVEDGSVTRTLRLQASTKGSYSAGVSAGGSHAPVVKSSWRTSSLARPHLVEVSR